MPRARPILALTILVGLAAVATPVAAQLRLPGTARTEQPLSADQLVKVRVGADVTAIRPGATFHLAVIFEIEPKWHVYWEDPGASGAPTEVTVRGPLGYTVGKTAYPRPEVIPDPAGTSFGYHDEVVLFVPVTAPANLLSGLGSVKFEVDAQYFVCKEHCLIGRATRSVTIGLDQRGGTGTSAPGPDARTIERYKLRLPRPLAEMSDGAARIDRSGSAPTLVITGSQPDAGDVSFLPIGTPGVTCGEPEVESDAGRFVMRIPLEVRPQNALGERLRATGLVTIGKRPDQPCYYVNTPLDPALRDDR